MRYCTHCGAEIMDEAVICVRCGCGANMNNPAKARDDTLETVVKVFLIVGCVSMGWAIVPLVWCIPMTVITFKKFKTGEKISTGLKICILLLVNMVAGICLLCMEEEK